MKTKYKFNLLALCLLIATVVLLSGFASCGNPTFYVQSFSPAKATVAGGIELTLKGTGFTKTSTVMLGEKECANVRLISGSEIRCDVQDHPYGKVAVTVKNSETETDEIPADEGFFYDCMEPRADGIEIWANNGEDKVAKEELRATCDPIHLVNKTWNGSSITLFGAKNEVVAFNLIIESTNTLNDVSVSFDTLVGPPQVIQNTKVKNTAAKNLYDFNLISSVPATGNGVFDWTNRNIELFYVNYHQIKGLSLVNYTPWIDERHVPKRFRREYTGDGNTNIDGQGYGKWTDRPDHDKYYPEIAEPLELVNKFRVERNKNQSIWADIYIPKTVAAGLYTGIITIKAGSEVLDEIPVELTVRKFTLPDVPNSKTMLFMGYENVSQRFLNVEVPQDDPVNGPKLDQIIDRYFQMAHRHKISIIDSNLGYTIWSQDRPRPSWEKRLASGSNSLFTSQYGYAGPGEGLPNDVFSIGTYSSWSWSGRLGDRNVHVSDLTAQELADMKLAMETKTNAWEQWFLSNAPSTERFLFLIDESKDYEKIELWSQWMKNNPGVGKNIKSFATANLIDALANTPSLKYVSSTAMYGNKATMQNAVDSITSSQDKLFSMYNSFRPAIGSFATEDDGISLRMLPWAQHKKKIHRWFYWQSTYYFDYQNERGDTDLFHEAQTFGRNAAYDSVLGMTDSHYGNGNGVLFYPGTDKKFPADSRNIDGPIASLRLKYWRRGIQDVDYIALASSISPAKTREILNRMVPKVLWEIDGEPGNVHTDITWSTNPDDWERAREELADIIDPPARLKSNNVKKQSK